VGPRDVPDGPLAIDTDAFSFIHLKRGEHEAFAALIAGHPLAMPFPVVRELKAWRSAQDGATDVAIFSRPTSRLAS
jgi:hypothetical protein